MDNTNQIGNHALWETRIPEMFSSNYNLYIDPASYIDDPVATAWKIIKESNALVDSVLLIEIYLKVLKLRKLKPLSIEIIS